MPTVRKNDHEYLEWQPKALSVFYTRSQLERLHLHFLHPSATKLYELLRRAKPSDLDTDTLSVLKEISRCCESCVLYSPRQLVFQVRKPNGARFNQEILIDMMYLSDSKGKSRPVLHVVDAGTRFSAAAFLPGSDVNSVWNTFVKIWSTVYVGFPESFLTDQGSVFVAKEWEHNCETNDIKLRHTGTESHNSLGAGEKYHSTLRTIYQKVRTEHRNVPVDVALTICVKAMNDSVGPHGLVPSLLVFGVMPRMPGLATKEFPRQRERLMAARTACAEREKIVSRLQVQRGIKSLPPAAADHKFLPGDYAYVYREGLKHYTGPHLIASVEQKCARLHLGEITGLRAFIAQLRPAPIARQETYDESIAADDESEARSVLFTETLNPGDPREIHFDDAKRKELMALIERGTFRIVLLPTGRSNL